MWISYKHHLEPEADRLSSESITGDSYYSLTKWICKAIWRYKLTFAGSDKEWKWRYLRIKCSESLFNPTDIIPTVDCILEITLAWFQNSWAYSDTNTSTSWKHYYKWMSVLLTGWVNTQAVPFEMCLIFVIGHGQYIHPIRRNVLVFISESLNRVRGALNEPDWNLYCDA